MKYLNYFKVREDSEDFDIIHAEIEKGIVFKGTNLWVLICAILIASVGLNMNSTAVIIGAMLISPLMGPINGVGYGLATYDFQLLKNSFINFAFAVIVSLLTSAFYFLISPVNTAHSELLARTSPTIYDVFIALFGGVAGMLALCSKLKGNVIPGVAIATALMPPICTAGYGLATLQFNFVFGALYLFTINSVYIAVAAMFVSKVMKLPIRTVVDKAKSRKVNNYVTAILIITAIPSVYFGYRLVQNERFSDRAKEFISAIAVQENNYLIESEINPAAKTIKLLYSGFGASEEEKTLIKTQALIYGLDSSRISILSGAAERALLEQKQTMLSETEELNKQIAAKTFEMQQLQTKLDSIKLADGKGRIILTELNKFYPQITSCSYSVTYVHPDTIKKPIVIYTTEKIIEKEDQDKIVDWTKSRLKDKNTLVYFD